MKKAVLFFLMIVYVFVENTNAQYSFVNYNHTNGLPLEEVKEIVEDDKGYIWLGGPLGLSRFDGRNFTHYYRGSSTHEVAGNIVNDIKITPSGDVVAVYEDNGISIYNHETDQFRSKTYAVSDSSDFPQYSIFFVHIENDTSAYLGGHSEGIFHINLKTLKSRKVPLDFIPYDMHPDPDKEGSYFLTRKGLHRLNMENLTLETLSNQGFAGINIIDDEVWYHGYELLVKRHNINSGKEKAYYIESSGIISGFVLVDQNLWVGTPDGIEVIDTASTSVVEVLKAGINVHDLQGTYIYKIYKDSKDRIWVGYEGGIGLYDPSKTYFNRTSLLTSQSTDLSVLNGGGFLSIDFYRKKVFRVSEKGDEYEVDINGALSEPLKQIRYGDKSLVLFFNGIGEYKRNTNSIVDYKSPFTESKTRGLIDLYIHKNKFLGIYRYKNALVVWDKWANKHDTIHLHHQPRGIIPVKDDKVIVYGVDLLWEYDLETGEAKEFALEEDQYNALGLDLVKIDRIEDHFWISTRINGIFKATINGNRLELIKHYTENEGLLNNNVVETYVDEYNNLFVQCRSHIFMLDQEKDRFFTLGGTTDVNFQLTFGLASIDSMVYALGQQSKYLDLRKVDRTVQELNSNIEKILINGSEKADLSSPNMRLQYFENNLSISFSTLEYFDPSSVKHRYRLKSNTDWISLDPGTKSVQLTALAAGNYNFQLSASRGDGLWSEPEEWSFSIKPPFWKRGWFLLLVFGLLALMGYAIYLVRMKRLKNLSDMNLKLAELESESLRAQMNPHFIFNSLNSIKSYIIKSKKEEAADYLTTFSKLMRAVLNNSKQKEISLKNEIEALSLYLQIEQLRLNHKFDYEINVSDEINADRIGFPPLIIQPFVENSIWHGFINKKSKGHLKINVNKNDDTLNVEVLDDGIGREASKKIQQSRGGERSYGIAITENRLSNIAKRAEIQIIDLFHENGTSAGTRVEINVPLKVLDKN
ncbi:MAG: histidine kinase [Saprospiraceae bacterium]|nr:histidine kinase [Saprospiraceae bacterium]